MWHDPCDILTCDHDVWHLLYNTFPYFFLVVSPNEKKKEKEKKRNINSNLAILPSHDKGSGQVWSQNEPSRETNKLDNS